MAATAWPPFPFARRHEAIRKEKTQEHGETCPREQNVPQNGQVAEKIGEDCNVPGGTVEPDGQFVASAGTLAEDSLPWRA